MTNDPQPDYIVDYADDPSDIHVPGHLGDERLHAVLAGLDLNDSYFGVRLDGAAMTKAAKHVWLRRGTVAEFEEHGPPDPDGVLEAGMDWWRPCDVDHPDAEAWTRTPVHWEARG